MCLIELVRLAASIRRDGDAGSYHDFHFVIQELVMSGSIESIRIASTILEKGSCLFAIDAKILSKQTHASLGDRDA